MINTTLGIPQTSEANSSALELLFVKLLQRDTVTTLSFTDPWGTAVAVEAKKKETRSWSAPTKYWGYPMAIHVSGTLTQEAKMICDEAPFREVLEKAGYSRDLRRRFAWNLPLKHIIAIAWLEKVERIELDYPMDEYERFFGNYQPGRYAWNFGAVYRLKQPIVATGHLGLWQWIPPESFWTEIRDN